MPTIYKRSAKWKPAAIEAAFTALDSAGGAQAAQFVAARKLADLIRFDTAESLAEWERRTERSAAGQREEGVVLFYLAARDVWSAHDPVLGRVAGSPLQGQIRCASKRLAGVLDEVFKRVARGW